MAEQVRIYREGTQPIGVVTWAYRSKEAEARLTTGGRPQVADWKTNDRCLIIALAAPTTRAESLLAPRIPDDLRKTVLKGNTVKLQQVDFNGNENKDELRCVN
nr:toxin-activating lysine-acyltransferase [Nitrospirillum iridis]